MADREIPIVHRVIKVHEKENGDVRRRTRNSPPAVMHKPPVTHLQVDLLTKGDNNAVDDRGLYAASQSWINKEHVIGRAKGYLPYIGMVTIIMNDYPALK